VKSGVLIVCSMVLASQVLPACIGVSPPTSKVTVEIEVRPHLTIGGEAGQSGSTGIGVNYNYDY
jgi:hypothetical protein